MGKVLVVDDEVRIRTLLSRTLSMDGHVVVTAPDGESALQRMSDTEIDLVLLDLVMPGRDGLDVLRSLADRQDETPVIVLSAVTDVGTHVQALEQGAVDVVTKPFSTAELRARVRRNVGTRATPVPPRYLTAGDVKLDLDRRRAMVDGREIALTEREFSLLAHLMRRRGLACRRDELLRDIWGLTADASNVVDACVRRLRQRLGDNVQIDTIRGVGYCLDAD